MCNDRNDIRFDEYNYHISDWNNWPIWNVTCHRSIYANIPGIIFVKELFHMTTVGFFMWKKITVEKESRGNITQWHNFSFSNLI